MSLAATWLPCRKLLRSNKLPMIIKEGHHVTIKPSLVKCVASLTIIFGLPLYFTKLIHESRFPQGGPFILVYTWGLLAVVALPVLLLAQFYILVRALKGVRQENTWSSFFISTFALCFGAIAECVFLLSRH